MSNTIKFVLNGCDILFIAEAPEDITLKELLAQCDRIEPDWCECGLRSLYKHEIARDETEIIFTKDSVKKANDKVTCTIHENSEWRFKGGI